MAGYQATGQQEPSGDWTQQLRRGVAFLPAVADRKETQRHHREGNKNENRGKA